MSEDLAYQLTEAHRRISNIIRPGTIAEVQLGDAPGTALARVKFSDDWTSDFRPVHQLHAGALGSWSAPVVGEQVLMLSPSGEPGAGWVLRGWNSGAKPAPSNSEQLAVLFAAGGASDTYDLTAKKRTITLPADGELVIVQGGAEIHLVDGKVTITGSEIDLGGTGGAAVARVGDHVRITAGSSAGDWPIIEGSGSVKCA